MGAAAFQEDQFGRRHFVRTDEQIGRAATVAAQQERTRGQRRNDPGPTRGLSGQGSLEEQFKQKFTQEREVAKQLNVELEKLENPEATPPPPTSEVITPTPQNQDIAAAGGNAPISPGDQDALGKKGVKGPAGPEPLTVSKLGKIPLSTSGSSRMV